MGNDTQGFKLNVNKTVVLELNYHCNLQCIHCYIPGEEKSPKKYMSYADAKMILDQIKEQYMGEITSRQFLTIMYNQLNALKKEDEKYFKQALLCIDMGNRVYNQPLHKCNVNE